VNVWAAVHTEPSTACLEGETAPRMGSSCRRVLVVVEVLLWRLVAACLTRRRDTGSDFPRDLSSWTARIIDESVGHAPGRISFFRDVSSILIDIYESGIISLNSWRNGGLICHG
jgi:hypothetical protein